MTEVYETLRYINIALSALLTVALLCRGRAFLRAELDSKFGRLAVFSFVTYFGYGTAETLVMGVPAGPRVPGATSVLLIAATWVVVEAVMGRRRRAKLARIRAA